MNRLRTRLAPYLLVMPGGLWLAIFFVIPMVYMLSVSLMTGNVIDGFKLTFHFQTYAQALGLYHDQLIRSLVYGLIATALCIGIAYPMAYWIAFRGGNRKSTFLFMILLPFFVSFVLRTISWQFFLSDNGIVLGTLKTWHLLPESASVLATAPAVVLGLTYNFLPFMVLPIYVALERVDHSLVEASYDLYANRVQGFLRVVFPLSLPGVFAGVLMTFVPASSDYVNASVLGGPENTMIGNVIQNQYFVSSNYPTAAALSFILMAVLLLGIFAYARALGTEDVLEAAAG
jgi:spermidine/putrescine transport system permease protein